ncbi:uncharacterized protein LOC141628528 [Silene latifolia]|uniref:uncharacterized protein LOC141628528 n=1 Tax=Silene latifolia TaxID=37657 RepID=UPI003D7893A8
MAYDSSLEFLEFFAFVHGSVGSEDDDDLHDVFTHLDSSPLSKIHALKELGNDLFRQKNFDHASSCYEKACRLLCFALNDRIGLEKNCVLQIAISLCLNLAACAIKIQAFQGALIFCSMVLNFFPRNAKALIRKAMALKSLNKFSEAQASLEEAVLVEPRNGDILRELEEVKKLQDIKPNGKRVVDSSLDAKDIRKGKRPATFPEIVLKRCN